MNIQTDYYDRLNLAPTATEAEIRQEYRKLARRYHPDVNKQTSAPETFRKIQEAYETLSDAADRKKYDQWRVQQGLDKSSALSVQATASHPTLQPLPEEQAYYVLLNIMPVANLPTARLPLNLCLVLDKSTSMHGTRLQKLKEAINHIVNKLHPDDALSLVTFSDRAEVLLPSQRNVEASKIKTIVSTIRANGGTEILHGLQAGLKEIERGRTKTSVNHLILLTDGQTYGDEDACLQQAKQAGQNQVHFSTIGIGDDWNEDLLDQMATLSGGASIYIDTPEKLKTIFSDTMHNLETVVARNVSLKFNLSDNVCLHEAYQMTPQISRLDVKNNKTMLGSLSTTQHQMVLLEFRIKNVPTGSRRLMRLTIEGDMPGQHQHRPWEWVELNATISPNAPKKLEIPAALTAALNKLAIFKMQEKVSHDVEIGQITKATQRLQLIATRLLDLGETNLANAALQEAGQLVNTKTLSATGRKTIRYGTRTLSLLPNEAALPAV